MNSSRTRAAPAVVYHPYCQTCARFMGVLRETGLIRRVRVFNAMKYDVSSAGIEEVPTVVLANGARISGEQAFAWLDGIVSEYAPPQGAENAAGSSLEFSAFSAAGGVAYAQTPPSWSEFGMTGTSAFAP